MTIREQWAEIHRLVNEQLQFLYDEAYGVYGPPMYRVMSRVVEKYLMHGLVTEEEHRAIVNEELKKEGLL